MELEVTSLSRDTIVPSNPTPPHLRTLEVSFFDRLSPPFYPAFVSFYRRNDVVNPESLIVQLKRSLSETLTRFYPVAGRVRDEDLTIDCNDKGVLFTTARVNCCMGELLAQPQPKVELFHRLAPPFPPLCLPAAADGPAQLAIQLNLFACGGVALCVFFFHRIIDAATIAAFLKSWAALANGKEPTYFPDYSAASIFPQGEKQLPHTLSQEEMGRLFVKEGKGSVKRFVFDREAISDLKSKATSQLVPNPTRVEAISAFIWKHCMRACATISGVPQHPSLLNYSVNLRARTVPPFSEYSAGNIGWTAFPYFDGDEEADVDVLVGLLRKAFEKVKDEFVPKLQGDGGVYEAVLDSIEEVREKCYDKKNQNQNQNHNPYVFSSWCKMGLEEEDFGMGKPIWVSQLGSSEFNNSMYKNIVLLMDGQSGSYNIEAWIILDDREMAILQADSDEFGALASLNPPILF